LLTRQLYEKWFPQILYDIHQMGQRGPRFVVPPFYEVSNPAIDPIILREIMLVGGHMATDLTAAGFTGIATEAIYDTWWHGGLRTAPYYHNVVGLLSEAASVKIATPVELKLDELTRSGRGLRNVREFQTNFPEPWQGGKWRLRDIIDLELEACTSVLTVAARYRDLWLRNFYRLGQRAIENGRNESPTAYLIPLDQKDPAAGQQLLDIMLAQGTELLRARESFVAEGMQFPAGTFVIDLAQPYRANVMALFERQHYPKRRVAADGRLERPYDVTGWTLPLLMGVEVIRAESRFDFEADTLRSRNLPDGRLPESAFASPAILADTEAPYYLFSPASLDAYRLLNRLHRQGKQVFATSATMTANDSTLAAGQFLVPSQQLGAKRLRQLAGGLNLAIGTVSPSAVFQAQRLRSPRVAVYRSFVPTADEGWTRLVLEKFEFDYQTIGDASIRRGRLAQSFDAIIIPDQRDSTILQGHSSEKKPGRTAYPAEYCGGIGQIGLRNLRQFVDAGGTLLAFDSATRLFIRSWALPIVNVVEKRKGSDFSAPGSILMGLPDHSHFMAMGLPREIALFFTNSPVFRRYDQSARSIVTYPLQEPLLSGWLQGGDRLRGKTALVEVPMGRGRLLLFGFRPQHRGQTYATFKLLFNGLLYAVAEPAVLGPGPVTEE